MILAFHTTTRFENVKISYRVQHMQMSGHSWMGGRVPLLTSLPASNATPAMAESLVSPFMSLWFTNLILIPRCSSASSDSFPCITPISPAPTAIMTSKWVKGRQHVSGKKVGDCQHLNAAFKHKRLKETRCA